MTRSTGRAARPAAWLCLNGGDDDACTTADALGTVHPDLRRAAIRLQRRRASEAE